MESHHPSHEVCTLSIHLGEPSQTEKGQFTFNKIELLTVFLVLAFFFLYDSGIEMNYLTLRHELLGY